MTEILDRPEPADLIAMEEMNGHLEGTSPPAGAQDAQGGAPQDSGNDAGGSGRPGARGSDDFRAMAATATATVAAAEAAGAGVGVAPGTPVARRKSSAQQQTLAPMLEQVHASDAAEVEAEASRIRGEEEGERRRRSSSSLSFSALAAGDKERTARHPTLETPRPALHSRVAAHVRGGGGSGSGPGAESMGGLVYDGLGEEPSYDGDTAVSRSRSSADLGAPSARRDGTPLTRNGVSALNLRDGGFAPGEEGCGRDEEL